MPQKRSIDSKALRKTAAGNVSGAIYYLATLPSIKTPRNTLLHQDFINLGNAAVTETRFCSLVVRVSVAALQGNLK